MADLISKVKELYAAFARKDVAAIIAHAADDIIWEYEGVPEIPSAGIYHSAAGMTEFFTKHMTLYSEVNLDMTEFFSSEDAVAVFGRFKGTLRANGVQVDIPIANYIKFRGEKVRRFASLANTAAVLEAIRGRAASVTA